MKICMVTSVKFPPECGQGVYIYNLSKKLIERGHSVTIITRGDFGSTTREDFEGIELYKVRFFPLYPFHVHIHGIFARSLFKKIESNFDIVHIHSPLPPIIYTKLPVLTTVHSPVKTSIDRDPNPLIVRLQGKISYLIECKILERSNKVTSVSKSVSHELADYGLNPSDISVIGNGVDGKLFHPISKRSGYKYVLFTGRLTYQKGAVEFIESAKKICSRYPDIKFKLAGKGPLLDILKTDIEKSGFSDRVEFLGHLGHEEKNKLVELYQNAHIFVMSSHYEGLPTTLLEAMSCGIPVIATDIAATKHILKSENNSIVIPIKSPEKMAEAISFLLNNSGLCEIIGKNARTRILEKYTWDKVTDEIINCYKNIL